MGAGVWGFRSKQITSHNQRMWHLSQTQTSHLFSKVLNRENCACKYCEALIVMNTYSIQTSRYWCHCHFRYVIQPTCLFKSSSTYVGQCFRGSSFSPEPHLHRACFCWAAQLSQRLSPHSVSWGGCWPPPEHHPSQMPWPPQQALHTMHPSPQALQLSPVTLQRNWTSFSLSRSLSLHHSLLWTMNPLVVWSPSFAAW